MQRGHPFVERIVEKIVGGGGAEVLAVRVVAEKLRGRGELPDGGRKLRQRDEFVVADRRRRALVGERDDRGRILRHRLLQRVDQVEERERVGRRLRFAANGVDRLAVRAGPIDDRGIARRGQGTIETDEQRLAVPAMRHPRRELRVVSGPLAGVQFGFDAEQMPNRGAGLGQVPPLAFGRQQRVLALGVTATSQVNRRREVRLKLHLQFRESVRVLRGLAFEQFPGRQHGYG